MAVPRQGVGGAALGDHVYVVGGLAGAMPSAVVERYDTVTDRWSAAAPLPAALHHVAVAAVGGTLYACGGFAGEESAVASVFAYDATADAWTPRAPLPTPRGAAAATVFAGRVYVGGGLRDGVTVGDLASYDPGSDAWANLPPVPRARDHFGMAATDLLLYAIGGREGGAPSTLGEAFSPPSNEWFKEVAPLLTARAGLALAALGGRLFAFGGEGNVASPLGPVPQPEMFDPPLNSWFPQPDMPTPRHDLAAVTVGSRIYVVGGATAQGFSPTGATEVFVPPSRDTLEVQRLLLAKRRTRLRLTALLADAADDPATVPLRIRVREGAADVVSVALGTGALRAKGRGWRAAPGVLPPGTTMTLRRRRALVIRLSAGTLQRPGSRQGMAVSVELGARRFSGAFR